MNEKTTKLARKLHRLAGTVMPKRPLEPRFPVGRPDKLPRIVKRAWSKLDHRERGRITVKANRQLCLALAASHQQ